MEKIRNKWRNTEIDFDMYFVRQPNIQDFSETGEVTPEWVTENLGITLQPNLEAITVIFINNRGDEKVPMTAWTIGHRFGHALDRRNKDFDYFKREIKREISDIFKLAYDADIGNDPREAKLRLIAQALGSMKSARDGKLRNYNEIHYEFLGQYILYGKVTLRFPPQIFAKKAAWGRPGYHHSISPEVSNNDLQGRLHCMEDVINQECERVLHSARGKIFVM